ncbi:MAG: SIMPL domain-containing protein [Pacificimonas sp.]
MTNSITWLAAAAIFALATPLAAQGDRTMTSAAMVPADTLLTISARGETDVAPDIARLSAGVVTQAATANEAMQQNRERMSRVIAALQAVGVADRDIQTNNLNLNPEYDYQDRRAPRITGYRAANMVEVKLRDLSDAGGALDALVSEGANQINGPSFSVDDEEAALNAARRDAMAKARARADIYASAAGMRVARIVSISEGGGSYMPRPVPQMARMAMDESASTPIQPGELNLGVNVNVVYELK